MKEIKIGGSKVTYMKMIFVYVIESGLVKSL